MIKKLKTRVEEKKDRKHTIGSDRIDKEISR